MFVYSNLHRCVRIFALLTTMLCSTGAVADEQLQAIAWADIRYPSSLLGASPVTGEYPVHATPWTPELGVTDGPLPLDLYLPGRWQAPRSQRGFGNWAYANESGRVRAIVTSGDETEQSPYSNEFGRVQLVWFSFFTRTSSDDPTFTLNQSHLHVSAQERGSGFLYGYDGARQIEDTGQVVLPIPPYAKMDFSVFVMRVGPNLPREKVFGHSSRVEGIGDFGTRTDCLDPTGAPRPGAISFLPTDATPFKLNYHQFERTGFLMSQRGEVDHDVPEKCEIALSGGICSTLFRGGESCFGTRETSIRYEVGPYTQEIDLSSHNIRPGDEYQILYQLIVEAGEDDAEQFVEAFLGDPLDNDGGGLTLQTSDTPTTGSAQFCNELGDPERYIDNNDGTVSDAATGLMWQRCPAGTEFDDAGTASAEDDLCVASQGATMSWEDALNDSAAQSTGSYQDWRLPNVKELQSLVAPQCQFAAIDRLAFPDTPWREFWSSTPQLGQMDSLSAFSVEFAQGSVEAMPIENTAFRRYVRDTTTPTSSRPAIRAGRAEVVEGDPGTNVVLSFPVWLSGSIDQDVQVDAMVEAVDAEAGVDFETLSVRLVIPPGQQRTQVDVNVIGDFDPEAAERVRLVLTNASSNAYIATYWAEGQILDNEPYVSFPTAEFEVLEDELAATAVIPLRLDKVPASVVSVDFATRPVDPVSATVDDYTAVQGSVVFNVGQQTAEVSIPLVNDDIDENSERLELVLSNATGANLLDQDAVLTIRIMDDDDPLSLLAINDTAMRFCTSATAARLACPQSGFPLQDAETGRDVLFPDNFDGGLGFSFSKLDANGNELPATSTSYSCLRDNVTGMIWEVKNIDPASLHNVNSTYSWHNTSGVDDGYDPGVANGGQCAASDCDTEAFVAAVNAAALCGHTNWRLPTAQEALDLASFDSGSPNTASRGLDSYFATHNQTYWTSTPFVGANEAWYVEYGADFGSRARLLLQPKSTPTHVRLVTFDPTGRP